MPKLHQYKTRDNYYVLTSIKGAIITFQLTAQGERKLKDAAVAPDDNFPRALLLDLCRSGDAFTGGNGVSEPTGEAINQLELDFAEDPEQETLFPTCDDCARLGDLHLSLLREQGALVTKVQCARCRDVTSHLLETCIPLRLVNLALFGRLFEIKAVSRKYDGVIRFENLLRSEFESKWEELRKLRRSSQQALFDTGAAGELDLAGKGDMEAESPAIEPQQLSLVQKAVAMFGSVQMPDRSHLEIIGRKWEALKKTLPATGVSTQDAARGAFSNALVFIQTKDLLGWTAAITESAATEYDKAMDRIGDALRVHGSEHRLFDGGHTIWGSWQASAQAAAEQGHDGLERFTGWVEAFVKDFTTPMGMPFVTLDKSNFDEWVERLAGVLPGVDRSYLVDLASFDALEVCASGLGTVGVIFALGADDQRKLGEALGGMGISSITAANPILGLVTIASAAYAYRQNQQLDWVGLAKGGGMAALSAAIFSALSFPVLVELVIVIALSTLFRKHVIDNAQLASWIRANVTDNLTTRAKELFNTEKLFPHPRPA